MKVPKVWGTEYWLVNNECYCAKILEINNGWRTSIHQHKEKKETFFVLSGKVEVLGKKVLEVGESNTVERNEWHALCGLKKSLVLEVSTHHEDKDSYRQDKSCKY